MASKEATVETFARSMSEMARSLDSWLAPLVRSKTVYDWRSEMDKPFAVSMPIGSDGRRVIRIAPAAPDSEIDALNQDIQAVFDDFLTAFGRLKSEVEHGRQGCSV
jgi:hypothetical protein